MLSGVLGENERSLVISVDDSGISNWRWSAAYLYHLPNWHLCIQLRILDLP